MKIQERFKQVAAILSKPKLLRHKLANYIKRRFSGDSFSRSRFFSAALQVRIPQYQNTETTKSATSVDGLKFIAFYLPQYHPIVQNDTWWGKGFTEWTNVVKALPNYVGHYQPHLPGELGFYDLRLTNIMVRQVELAQQYGITGFCFYHYWFGDQTLLDMPIKQLVDNDTLKLDFCLCWVNENWSRNWDGLGNDLLIKQTQDFETAKQYINKIAAYIKDIRYLRIDGKSVLLVYRPNLLQSPQATFQFWRDTAREKGLGELFILGVETNAYDPIQYGMDGSVEFPPHGMKPIPELSKQVELINPSFNGRIFNYDDVANGFIERPIQSKSLFRTVMLSWDNTARRQNDPMIFKDFSLQTFKRWLRASASYTFHHLSSSQRLIFINAWNEWSEGTHLEPDRRFGYSYLNSVLIVQQERETNSKIEYISNNVMPTSPVATIAHLYYQDLFPDMLPYMKELEEISDLFITCPYHFELSDSEMTRHFTKASVIRVPNQGRDILPFVMLFPLIQKFGYKYIAKIHGKKSIHRQDEGLWRRELIGELFGSSKIINNNLRLLAQPTVGMIAAYNNLLSTHENMGDNLQRIKELNHRLKVTKNMDMRFAAGSMFWSRTDALKKLTSLNLTYNDFEDENGQIDGTMAHALERYFGFLVEQEGYRAIETRTGRTRVNANKYS